MVIEMRGVLLALLGASVIDAWAVVYTCIGKDGVERRQDHRIADCATRQRILNPDGSTKEMVPPTLTPDEQAAREAEKSKQEAEKRALREAAESDVRLKARYPDEEAHRRKRQEDLEPSHQAMSNSRARLEELAAERKLLMDQAEFYRGRRMPQNLRDQIAANDASKAAQLEAIQDQLAEQTRINKSFDMELERLRKLWNGALPGSLGPPLR